MATFERTWAFDMNRAITPSTALDLTRRTVWTLAAQLTGNLGGLVNGLWTLYASSDSSTAGTDSTDRWVLAGPYDGTKLVRASGSNAHSWIVLKSPTMNGSFWYMTISLNSAGDDKIRVYWSKTAPSGGSTTVTPTATDSWSIKHTTLSLSDININAAAADNSRCTLGLTSGGDFYFLQNKQAAGAANLFVAFMRLADYHASDAVPIWARVEYNATGTDFLSIGADGSSSPYNNVGPFGSGSSSNAWANMRNFANTGNSAAWIAYPCCTNNTTALTVNKGLAAHPAGGYSDFPCWVLADDNAGSGGGDSQYVRGRIPDLAICIHDVTIIAQASGSPTGGSQDSSRAGDLWLPTNAVFNFG